MSNAKFIIISGPSASYGKVDALENRTLYNCPEAYKWDKHVAEYINHIIDIDEPCAIITQSEIVIHQFLIRLKNDRLNVNDIEMYFCDEEGKTWKLDVKQHGRIRKSPPDFMAQHTSDLTELL